VRDEKIFTPGNVGSMKLLWRIQLNSTSRSMHNLFPPLIAESVMTPQGSVEVGLVAGVSDDLFAINVANGQVLWRRRFENRLSNLAPVDNVLCPGGQTAVPALVQTSPGKYTVYAVSWDGRLHQINLGDGENVASPETFIPGTGLRGPDERLSRIRSGVTPSEHIHSGGRRIVGAPRGGDRC
jgi:outer membrane protein assembly factor BamB